jgi:hypothetical protein
LEDVKTQILVALEKLKLNQVQRETILENRIMMLTESSTPVNNDTMEDLPSGMQDLYSSITTLEGQIGTAVSDHLFLRGLWFGNISSRYRKIPTAHSQTFAWIFEPRLPDSSKTVKFANWLLNYPGTKPYWIRGKAGSGKSTLMKFICSHYKTREYLEATWSGMKKLVIADFFFWNAGTKLQKSQEGLLRSLLFKVLQACPELISSVRQKRHIFLGHDIETNDWSLVELLFICRELMSQVESTKFCFFIDGLDEYEGDHRELLVTVKVLSGFPDIKLCVSSRPWSQFVNEFGQDSEFYLKLEDLTRNDIRRFVYGQFNDNREFQRVKMRNEAYSSLVEEVVNRAQGVFLWVFLVVRSLMEGLVYGDRISDLTRRLDSFPDGLAEFFQHMVNSIPKIYWPQTAMAFQLATSQSEPVLLFTYSVFDDLEDDPDSLSDKYLESISTDDLFFRLEQMTRRLDARSKGLLETIEDEPGNYESHEEFLFLGHKVDFLHRTVRDFLMESTDIYDMLEASPNPMLISKAMSATQRFAKIRG